jgi:sulfur transfer protein SufE
MLQEMACPRWHTIRASLSKQRLVQLAQLSQVHVKNGHAPRNGLSYMACPESRLVRGLVQLAVTNYFGMDRIIVMWLV